MSEIDPLLDLRIKQIEEQIKHLLKMQEIGQMESDGYLPIEQRQHANLLALRSIVFDLATRAGVSTERVAECFVARARYFLDQTLQKYGDTDPSLGARADDRRPDEVSTDETLPPLFDDPSNPTP